MQTHSIGIDFGTSKTLVSHINPNTGKVETLRLGRGHDYLPTSIYIDQDGGVYFGDDADDMLEDISGSYYRNFKMHLGESTPIHIYLCPDGSLFQLNAKDLVTKYLQHIRQQVQELVYHGEVVNKATITRPVKFSPAQCQELEEAAKAAGFAQVEFTTEPEAAGLAYCKLNAAKAFARNALIVDWGGGTLDFSLVSRHGDMVTTHSHLTDGDVTMGGEKFDERLWLFVSTELKKKGVGNLSHISQLPKVRKAKEVLSSKTDVTLYLSGADGACPPLEVSRTLLNALIANDVEKATQQVAALIKRIPAEHKPEMLLLVGGTSQIPYIQEQMSMASGLPTQSWHLSHEAVALGAAMWMSTEAPQTDESARKATTGTARKATTGTARKATTGTARKATTGTARKATTGTARKATTGTAKKAPACETLTAVEKVRMIKLQETQALLKADPEWPKFLQEQKQALLNLRDELLPNMQNVNCDHLRSGASNVSSSSGLHIDDTGGEAEVRDLTIRLLDKDREQLFEIDAALERIRHGTYGICEISLDPIPKKRLQVRPFCRLTVKCQEEYEKKYGGYANYKAKNRT